MQKRSLVNYLRIGICGRQGVDLARKALKQHLRFRLAPPAEITHAGSCDDCRPMRECGLRMDEREYRKDSVDVRMVIDHEPIVPIPTREKVHADLGRRISLEPLRRSVRHPVTELEVDALAHTRICRTVSKDGAPTRRPLNQRRAGDIHPGGGHLSCLRSW